MTTRVYLPEHQDFRGWGQIPVVGVHNAGTGMMGSVYKVVLKVLQAHDYTEPAAKKLLEDLALREEGMLVAFRPSVYNGLIGTPTVNNVPGILHSHAIVLRRFRLKNLVSMHVFLQSRYPNNRTDRPLRWDIPLDHIQIMHPRGHNGGRVLTMWNPRVWDTGKLHAQFVNKAAVQVFKLHVKGGYRVVRVEIHTAGDRAAETSGAVMIHDDAQYYDERDAAGTMQNGQAVLIWTGLGHELSTAEGHECERDYATMTTDFAALEAAMQAQEVENGDLGGTPGKIWRERDRIGIMEDMRCAMPRHPLMEDDMHDLPMLGDAGTMEGGSEEE